MAAIALFVLGVLAVVHAVLGLFRIRQPAFFTFGYFVAGFATIELARFHLMWMPAAALVLVLLGGLSEPIGGWGLGLVLASWIGTWAAHWRGHRAADAVESALTDELGDLSAFTPTTPRHGLDEVSFWFPFRHGRPDVEVVRNLPYGDAGRRNLLDLYRPVDTERAAGSHPVLLQIHGGGWVSGRKEQQAQPLMWHLAARGWVCVAVNYRLSPAATFPDHIVDVKRSIHWIHEHADAYGLDPSFIVATGGSAGGHLAALAALTPNEARWQPGFADTDTSLAGCVPFYAPYDFLDRNNDRGRLGRMGPFLARYVMKSKPEEDPEAWDRASPIANVGPHAPPFFVIHGTHDTLVYVEEARSFVGALRDAADESVVYAEIPGAQHAFDIAHSPRSHHVLGAVERWLAWLEHTRRPAADDRGRLSGGEPAD